MNKGYIYSPQLTLTGQREIIGYTITNTLIVRLIPRDTANKIIKNNHYSGTICNTSYLHLGVYLNGKIVGCLQYGYAMNPASGSTIVPNISNTDYLELNRMWLADIAYQYLESQVISASIKIIRGIYPNVCFIQSFADERCNKFGCVYQACSFDYYGEHTSVFYELDGEWFHNIVATSPTKGGDKKRSRLMPNIERATKTSLRQFRYIKFLKPWAKKKCTLTAQPYPKPPPTV
jgi:hypothetical protein